MAPPPNLRRRGTRYHFRRKVPPHLRARFGRAEWVRSLQTADRRVAAARAREVWLAIEGVLRRVSEDPTITRAQIDQLTQAALADFAWADEVRLATHGRHFDVQGPAPADFEEIARRSEEN